MKTFILLISLALTFIFDANAQSILKGQIFSDETGKEISFAQIMLYNNHELVSRSTSNEIGEYLNYNLDKRFYDIVISSPGKVPIFINDELLIERATTVLNFYLIDQAQMPINALKFSAPSVTGHQVENNINKSEKQNPIVVQKEIPIRNKHLDALSGFVECGCFREGCIHTLPARVFGNCHTLLIVGGERSDLTRREKKYWFTPLDLIGDQGLSPEYSTHLSPPYRAPLSILEKGKFSIHLQKWRERRER